MMNTTSDLPDCIETNENDLKIFGNMLQRTKMFVIIRSTITKQQ